MRVLPKLIPFRASIVKTLRRSEYRPSSHNNVCCSAQGRKDKVHSKTDSILDSGTLMDTQSRSLFKISQAGYLGDDLLAQETPFEADQCEEIVLGIDPDRNGSIAILKSTRTGNLLQVQAQVIDVPVYKATIGKTSKGRERIDAVQLAALMKRLNFPTHKTVAFLEGGGVEYHFSSYSAFVQGMGVGIWEGVLSHAGIPWHKINSKTWKTLFALLAKKKDPESKKAVKIKASSVALARQVFPELDEHLSPKGKHGRADALLIASYGHLVRVQEQGLDSTLKHVFLEAGIEGISSERLRLDLLTANELKLMLKERGLKVSGNKGELIERLLEHSGNRGQEDSA